MSQIKIDFLSSEKFRELRARHFLDVYVSLKWKIDEKVKNQKLQKKLFVLVLFQCDNNTDIMVDTNKRIKSHTGFEIFWPIWAWLRTHD